MSQENVELVRQGLDAVNRRDRAAWLALCDPELENIPPQDWPESDPIRGGEPVFDFLAVEAQDAWEEDSSPLSTSNSSMPGTTESWRICDGRCEARRAAPAWRGGTGRWSRSATGRCCVSNGSVNEPKPSKPWASRSRRCRGRVWRSCGGSAPAGSVATSAR